MTPESFVYWLQGFLEVANPKKMDEKQIQIVKDHLGLVFKKETPDRHSDIALKEIGKLLKVQTGYAGNTGHLTCGITPQSEFTYPGTQFLTCSTYMPMSCSYEIDKVIGGFVPEHYGGGRIC